MSYATKQDFINRFSLTELAQLTDDSGRGKVDDAQLGLVIADTDALIDSYIGQVATLPLTATPPVLTAKAVDIIRYNLYSQQATDEVEARYKAAIAWLGQVAAGKVTLGVTTESSTNSVVTKQGISGTDWDTF